MARPYLHPDKHVSVSRILVRTKARKDIPQRAAPKPSGDLIAALAQKMLLEHTAAKTNVRHIRTTEDSPGYNPQTQGNHRAGRKRGSGAGAVAGYQISRNSGRH